MCERRTNQAASGDAPCARRLGWLLGLLLVLILLPGAGCRSLRPGRQARELSAARQFSLRGAEKLQQRKLSDAEALFSEALRHSAADERAQWGIAEVLWQQGERARAIDHMVKAAEISGENPDLLVRLGDMYLQEGYVEQALEQADAALQGNWRHANAWALRGQALQERGDLEHSMDCYHRALICQPNSPDVQVALAEIYQAMGRPQRALATLEHMTDGQYEEQLVAKAWMLKGQALASLGEGNAARSCWDNAALCATEEETELLLQLAKTRVDCGDCSDAEMCLARILRHDPQNPEALRIREAIARSLQPGTPRNALVGFEQPAGSSR